MGNVLALPRNNTVILYSDNGVSGDVAEQEANWMLGKVTAVGLTVNPPFTKVFIMSGGFNAWKAAGYPTAVGQ